MTTRAGVALPGPLPRYDRENEAIFRRQLEQVLNRLYDVRGEPSISWDNIIGTPADLMTGTGSANQYAKFDSSHVLDGQTGVPWADLTSVPDLVTAAGLTTGVIPKASGAQALADSKLSDDGTTLEYTGSAIRLEYDASNRMTATIDSAGTVLVEHLGTVGQIVHKLSRSSTHGTVSLLSPFLGWLDRTESGGGSSVGAYGLGQASHPTGTISGTIYGTIGFGFHTGAGTSTRVAAVGGLAAVTAGTVTHLPHFYAPAITTMTGTITNLYGLLIGDMTAGGTNYAIKTGAGAVDFGDHVNVASGKTYKVNGTQVLAAQGAAVADATDATSVITQLNALLARCRAHGLIAT